MPAVWSDQSALLVNISLQHEEEIHGAQVQWIGPWELAERVTQAWG